jgi:uncharacterized protein (TIRG00374 family)
MRGNLRKIILAVLVLGILVALALRSRRALHSHGFSAAKLLQAIRQANVPLLLLCAVLIYACYAIRALRWNRFSTHIGKSTFLGTYSATLMGFAAVFVLGRAGEPVRPLLIARKNKLPVPGMFGIYVLERLFDFASAAVIAVVCLLFFSKRLIASEADPDWVGPARHGAWVLLGLVAALICFLAYYRLHGGGRLTKRLETWHSAKGWRASLATVVDGFSQGLQAIQTVSDLAIGVFYSALHWGIVALIYLWTVRAFGDFFSDMNYPAAMLLLSVTLVGSTLQLPGVGGGAQVATFYAFTQIFGVDEGGAVVVALVLWLISFALSAIVGVPLLIREGWSLGELKQLAKAERAAEAHGEHVSDSTLKQELGPDARKGKRGQ